MVLEGQTHAQPEVGASGGATGGVHRQPGSGLLAAGHAAHPHDRGLQSGFVEMGTTSHAFFSPQVSCHSRPWAQCPPKLCSPPPSAHPHPVCSHTGHPQALCRLSPAPQTPEAFAHAAPTPESPATFTHLCLVPGRLRWGAVSPELPPTPHSHFSVTHSWVHPPECISTLRVTGV